MKNTFWVKECLNVFVWILGSATIRVITLRAVTTPAIAVHLVFDACTKSTFRTTLKRQFLTLSSPRLSQSLFGTSLWWIEFVFKYLLIGCSKDYQHYSNAYEPVICTFYVLGRLKGLVITSGTCPEHQPDQHLLSLRFHPVHLCCLCNTSYTTLALLNSYEWFCLIRWTE